jgi:Integrase core domain
VRYLPADRLWLSALSRLIPRRQWAELFAADGIRVLASPPQAPRADAICERIIGTLRRELFDRLLIVNERHLRQVLNEYLLHYNTARPHRALGQLAPTQTGTRPPEINLAEHRIHRNKSSADSHTSTRSPPNSLQTRYRKPQVTGSIVDSSPTGCGYADMVFAADDRGAWLAGLLADAGRKKLTTLVLGSEQERALRQAATAAIQLTAPKAV